MQIRILHMIQNILFFFSGKAKCNCPKGYRGKRCGKTAKKQRQRKNRRRRRQQKRKYRQAKWNRFGDSDRDRDKYSYNRRRYV